MAARGNAGGDGEDIEPFEGGNDKQRTKLNKIVTAVNKGKKLGGKVTALETLTEPMKGMERENIILWVNGALVQKAMLSQTIEIFA
jgi:hypothetical protein